MERAELIIVGGGIVGLATGYNFQRRYPDKKVIILEKEGELARHQTGHNSGVLHSGIYYRPGSLKAENCRFGKLAMEEFCRSEGVSFEICGKVIVAVDDSELGRLDGIYERGQANGVKCELIGPERLREIEPYAAGIKAIHVPEAGIIDFVEVCERLGGRILENEGEIHKNTRVVGLKRNSDEIIVETTRGEFASRFLVNCAGLHSDRVTSMSESAKVKIVPFRGEYFKLRKEAYHLCRNLIYPVPDPRFPFLGVHFTRMIDGAVECGPNAVLAFAREGYKKIDFNAFDLFETLSYPAFWKVATRYWRTALGEIHRSLSKKAFVKALQRLVPDIRADQIYPAPSGIRAQALASDGELVDDFFIQGNKQVLNVCNAPSPAATASLNIGKLIVNRLAARTD
ncbi:MAG: L-2-hydroxyglutarate oxidase LhgO [Candidatus Moanabacter tarae]|uniref:L-2-hydroxyglutarate oxidase LhgO n=1 Tax=Candidatus Moanibacter tarae TaxID=2200854 RepID=A0A2Z4AD45_9BACT|nr:MAG: L-2-hydroxyglutarate oxidase LhgO [Candidatus Moanabacter tarae]|tara:strand:+ start:6209 stop:7405 length:1197 start_codon:yes stop_codon:yes gene_type:complete